MIELPGMAELGGDTDNGGTMKDGMPSRPGPHCQAARKTTNSATLATVPLRTARRGVLSLRRLPPPPARATGRCRGDPSTAPHSR